MKFSHLKNDIVYLKGTEEDKDDILTLINDFKDKYTIHTCSYADAEPETIEQVKINFSGDVLTLLKNDLNIIVGVMSAIVALGSYTERLGISKGRVVALSDYIYEIHSKAFDKA